jgi:hypothetical protein
MVLSSKPPAAASPTALAHGQQEHEALVQEMLGASRRVRARIYGRADGLYSVEFERLMPGDPEHQEPAYWSPINRPKTIVDTLERARAMALDGLVEEAAGSGR